jgi:hypothetical protein
MIHHGIVRAHCGAPIFASDAMKAFVIERAARVFAETKVVCLAGAVLRNHFHVVVRCEGPPGPSFARLNTGIAWQVARSRGDRGAVFESRFYSDPCDDEDSLLARMVYVVGNPLHHRVVASIDALRTYRWSSLGEILGLREPRWTDVEAALAALHPDPAHARAILLEALEAKAVEWAADGGSPEEDRGLDSDVARRESPMPGAESGVLPPAGGRQIVVACQVDEPVSCLRNALRRERWTPDRLLVPACGLTGAVSELVRAGAQSRREVAARGIAAYVACDVAGETMVHVAPILGVGPTALLNARRRGGALLAQLGIPARDVLESSRGA